jgi:catechol 2,3-dioxygenase-like lactoylglutathione lyase family enzyme
MQSFHHELVPKITRVLETALYVNDLEESVRFDEGVMGPNAMSREDRLVALDAGRGTVLLLFRRGATSAGASFPAGRIPPHDGVGPAHFAFAISTVLYRMVLLLIRSDLDGLVIFQADPGGERGESRCRSAPLSRLR